jgi:hypothetical protein
VTPTSLAGETGARRVTPALFVLVIACFFLTFSGVSCNTTATKTALQSLAGSSGVSTSQTAVLDTCLNALKDVNVLTYSGWGLVAGRDPSIASLPAACDTGTSLTARDASQVNLGPQLLAILALISAALGLLWALAGLFGIVRARSRAVAAIIFGVASGAQLLLDQQRIHDLVLARIAASAGSTIPAFRPASYFNVNPGLGLVIAVVVLAVAVLYNLAALMLGEGGASDTVPALPEGPPTIPP